MPVNASAVHPVTIVLTEIKQYRLQSVLLDITVVLHRRFLNLSRVLMVGSVSPGTIVPRVALSRALVWQESITTKPEGLLV